MSRLEIEIFGNSVKHKVTIAIKRKIGYSMGVKAGANCCIELGGARDAKVQLESFISGHMSGASDDRVQPVQRKMVEDSRRACSAAKLNNQASVKKTDL